MYCTKCGRKLEEDERYCAQCGTLAKGSSPVQKARICPKIPPKAVRIAVVVLAAVLILSGVRAVTGTNNWKSAVSNYFASIEQQSFSLLRKAVQSDIADQLDAEATGKYSSEIALVNYDLGDATPMSSGEISELEQQLAQEYGVTVNISKAYNVNAYVRTTTIWGDSQTDSDKVLQVYKTKGKWYIVPLYSHKR